MKEEIDSVEQGSLEKDWVYPILKRELEYRESQEDEILIKEPFKELLKSRNNSLIKAMQKIMRVK